MSDQPKEPRIEIRGVNIEPETFGEAVWALLKEYADKSLNAENLSSKISDQRDALRNVTAAVCEAILIHGSAKWKLDAIELLGILAKIEHNVLRIIERSEMNRMYQQRAAEQEANAKAQKEADSGPRLVTG